jgi:hypothetical protein
MEVSFFGTLSVNGGCSIMIPKTFAGENLRKTLDESRGLFSKILQFIVGCSVGQSWLHQPFNGYML